MAKKIMVVIGAVVMLAGPAFWAGCHGKTEEGPTARIKPVKHGAQENKPAVLIADPRLQKAVFAGGRFWCLTPAFAAVPGVKQVVAGYAGCQQENPTYEKVEKGDTGCRQAVMVVFDPRKVEYKDLLQVFWRQIDPTDSRGQFGDRGDQYRTAIYYLDYNQKMEAERSKAELAASGRFDKPIVTMILPSLKFDPAELFNQDYDQKNPAEYERYRQASGRDQFLEKVWANADKTSGAEGEGESGPAPAEGEGQSPGE